MVKSRLVLLAMAVSLAGGDLALALPGGSGSPDRLAFPDPSGLVQTVSAAGRLDPSNPFFQELGTNGRRCATCHDPAEGWSITPPAVQKRFARTRGTDPLFHSNDGTNSPNADTSTVAARREASSMLLNKAVIRVGMGIPAGAEFTLAAVDDPYGYASATELFLFRRPLPSTNLRFLSAVMWDGREDVERIAGDPSSSLAALRADLAHQAIDATTGHAQAAAPPTDEQVQQIVDFEAGLSTAQVFDRAAGWLNADGAAGGSVALAQQPFFIGINDPLGGNPSGAPFAPDAFTLFDAWQDPSGHTSRTGWNGRGPADPRRAARLSVARGEKLFNEKPINITGVGGLNDALGLAVIPGTCSTCHDAPNVGGHSLAVPLNIGLTDASRRTPDLPLYTLQNTATGEQIQTTDPGRALITGKWSDIGKFKGAILRGLAARAPYFHNGSAATLEDVVEFYDTRFKIGFTSQEKRDLVAFLKTL